MKLNNFLKVMLAVVIAVCFSVNADAQFKGLGNKIKDKAKNIVKGEKNNAKDNAVSATKDATKDATETATEAVTGKKITHDDAPVVDANSYFYDVLNAFYYWANLQDKANKDNDIDWLCSLEGQQSSNVFQLLTQHKEAGTFSEKVTEASNYYSPIAKATRSILYNGKPDIRITDNATLAQSLAWYVEKAKSGSKYVRNFYTTEGGAVRYLYFISKKYTDEGDVAAMSKELQQLWDQVDYEVKAQYPNCDPYMSVQEAIAANKKGLDKLKQEFDEMEAARQAEIAASTKSAKEITGAMNAQWNAKVFKLAKQRVPDCTKVIVYSNAWDVKQNGFVILRRCIYAWVIKADGSATDYGFCQDYQGGGKYGALRNYSIGMRHIFVK